MTNPMIPEQAVEAAMRAWGVTGEDQRNIVGCILEAAAPHMQVVELAAEYRRGYRDGLTDRKQVTAEPRAWEPGDPIE